MASPAPRLRTLQAAELEGFCADQNPDPGKFPEQQSTGTVLAGRDYHVVTLDALLAFVVHYADSPEKTQAQRANARRVRFNVETKRVPDAPETIGFFARYSAPSSLEARLLTCLRAIGDGFDGSEPGTLERTLVETLQRRQVVERVIVQSFDLRSLVAIHQLSPDIAMAMLTRDEVPDFPGLVAEGVTLWSPRFASLNAPLVFEAHAAGMQVVPWTVNDPDDMLAALAIGVDGLITDRPDVFLTLPRNE